MVLPKGDPTRVHFHSAQGFATLILAYMLDSLVRVSRRVVWNHFVNVLSVGVKDRDGLRGNTRGVSQAVQPSTHAGTTATQITLQTSVQPSA